jgi:hypothetical protein
MRSLVPGVLILALVAVVGGRVLGGDEGARKDPPRRALTADTDACQWVTAALPITEDAQVTAFHGPFFITYLAPGDPLQVVVENPNDHREGILLATISEVSNGARIFVPANAWVLAPKGSGSRLYSGFRPYGER